MHDFEHLETYVQSACPSEVLAHIYYPTPGNNPEDQAWYDTSWNLEMGAARCMKCH
jgi:hypothetical protein